MKNIVFLLSHLFTFLFNVAILLIVTKYLSPSEYVEYGIVTSLVNMLVPVATLGLIPFVIRHFRNSQDRQFDLGYVTRAVFVLGMIIATAGLAAAAFAIERPISVFLYVLALIAIVSTAASNVAGSVYRAARQPFLYMGITAGQKLLQVCCLFIFFSYWPQSRSSIGFIMCLTGAVIGTLALLRFDIFPNHERGKERNGAALRQALAFTVPAAFSNTLLLTVPFIERVYMDGQIPDGQIAQYVFNFDAVGKVVAAALLVMKLVVFPYVATGKKEEEKRRYKKAVSVALVGIVPGYVTFYAASFLYESSFGILLGSPQYLNLEVFRIAGIYATLVVLNYVALMGLMITGNTRPMAIAGVLFLVLHVGGLVVLVPEGGLTGAALSIVIAQAISTSFCFLANAKKLREYA